MYRRIAEPISRADTGRQYPGWHRNGRQGKTGEGYLRTDHRMNKPKKALLIVNLGTPDSPDIRYVRKFLSEFLNDRQVIDLPWLFRKVLVNLVIVPFRASRSSKLYRRLWTGNGSPMQFYLSSLVAKLEVKLKPDFDVYGVMRYGHPSLIEELKKIKEGYDEITVFPMFPQYASSTSGSVEDVRY